MHPKLFLPILAAAVAAPLSAPLAAEDGELARCLERSGGVTVAMIDCNAAAAGREDARLNRLWRENSAFVESERGKEIAAAQRHWIAYRDATCRAEGAMHEGSFSGVQLNACLYRLTKAQADWLDTIFELAAEQSR